MPTAAQINAQGFYIDESGNVQRQVSQGQYGFRGFWKDRKEFSGGLPLDYDWRKLDRPEIVASHGPLGSPFGLRLPKRGPQSALDEPREAEPYGHGYGQVSGRFKNRRALAAPETDVNNPRSHWLTNVGVSGMTTDPFGQIGERRGALSPGTQFSGVNIQPQTAMGTQRAIGPGPSRFPGAIDTTAT